MSVTHQGMEQSRKMHPHKFAMWLAIGSMVMMFAGLTSAFLVREAQGNWRTYTIPTTFWVSTIAIILSSITISLAIKAFRQRAIPRYRKLVTATLVLGLSFCVLQIIGFQQLYNTPQIEVYGDVIGEAKAVQLDGNPSESFLFIITGLHLLHLLGGIIALVILYFKAFRKKVKEYNTTSMEVLATYWHFVDVLWIYLFLFFLVNL